MPSFVNLLRTLLCMCLVGIGLLRAAGDPKDVFRPSPDGGVNCMTLTPDGRLLIGGAFGIMKGDLQNEALAASKLVMLKMDGSIDNTFGAGVDAPVNAVLAQADGKFVIGGSFKSVQDGRSYQSSAVKGLVRLNADSSVDTSFGAGVSDSFATKSYVYSILRQNDGKLIVGGAFDRAYGTGQANPTTVGNIVRLNSDGTIDTTFSAILNGQVSGMALQPDGKIIVVGGFTTVKGKGDTAAVTRNRIARLNTDGSLDTTFDPSADNLVSAVLLLPNGKIMIGGSFMHLAPNKGSSSTKEYLARLNADGTLDTNYNPTVNSPVLSLKLQSNGSLLLGGRFTEVKGHGASSSTVVAYLARLSPEGVPDATFSAFLDQYVTSIVTLDDGRIIAGGWFKNARRSMNEAYVPSPYVARFTPDGSYDTKFQVGGSVGYSVLAVQSDGKVIIGGSFSSIAGLGTKNVVRVTDKGVLDSSFSASITGTVLIAKVLKNGKVAIGGTFSYVNDVSKSYFAVLNADGTTDSSYSLTVDGEVTSIVEQSDGKLVIAGKFIYVGSTQRYCLARFNTDGTLDTTWNPGPNTTVSAVRILPDGRFLVGGQFTGFTPNGGTSTTSVYYLAVLKADGTVDTSFIPQVNSYVNAIELQADGKILLGGQFTAMGYKATTYTRTYVARLTSDLNVDEGFAPLINGAVDTMLQTPDKDIVISGYFSSVNSKIRYYVARLNEDGTTDESWDLNPNQYVYDMALCSDGSVLLAGAFSWFNITSVGRPTFCANLAKVSASGVLDTSFTTSIPGTAGGSVDQISVADDRSVIVGGTFTNFGTLKANNLARFGPNGIPDLLFNPNPDATVRTILALPLTNKVPDFSNRFVWLNANGTNRTDISALEITKINGTIYAEQVLPDGRVVIAGAFTVPVGSEEYKNLIILKADGSIDASFHPEPNAEVYGLALDSSNRLLVGGAFTAIGGVSINYMARMSLSGVVETGFNISPNALVRKIAIQSDKKIIVAGSFTNVTTNTTSVSRKYLARFSEDGSLDGTFDPGPDSAPATITVLSDGRLLMSGAFTYLMPTDALTSTTVNYMVRMAADGTVDTTFKPNFNNAVLSHIVQSDGKILVAGAFTTVKPNDATDTTDLTYIGRLNSDGTVDTSFSPKVDSPIYSMVRQSDGKVLIGGYFSTVNSTSQSYFARLNADGTLDTSFAPVLDSAALVIAICLDGSIIPGGIHSYAESDKAILVGGDYSNIGKETRAYLALVNRRGQAIASFVARPNAAVYASARQADGWLLVGGAFTKIGSTDRKYLARLDETGALESLSVDIDGPVSNIAVQADGKILLAGSFKKVGGVARAGLARIDGNGVLDASFNPGVDGSVYVLRVEQDGSIYVGGAFTTIAGSSRPYLARLTAQGLVDTTFTAAPDAPVRSINCSQDGRVFIGGTFTKVGTATRAGFATLTAKGELADSITTGANGSVNTIAITHDGRVMLGGTFTQFRGAADYLLTRMGNSSMPKESIVVDKAAGTVRWYRSGSTAKLDSVIFEYRIEREEYVRMAVGSTSDGGATWSASGLTFPAGVNFYIRARGISAVNTGSSMVETVGAIYIGTVQNYVESGTVNAKLGSPISIGGDTNLNGTTFTASGLPEGMSIDPTTGRIYGTPTVAGAYVVTVHYTNGMVEGSWVATIVVGSGQSSPDSSSAKVTAFSARGLATGDHPVIIGFVVSGNAQMPLMLRGVGPSLLGVDSAERLKDVRIRLFRHFTDGSSQEVLSKNGWSHSAEFDQATARLGFVPFEDGSKDSAVLVTLNPGMYSFWVESTTGGSGLTMGEVYDANQAGQVGASRLTGCSARGYVTAGKNELIGGFILQNETSTQTLVRAVGPSLVARGVPTAMSNPQVYLYDVTNNPMARNDDWAVQFAAINPSIFLLPAAEVQAAMPTPALAAKDAALMSKLQAGIYTVVASSADNSSGDVLLEFLML